MKPIRLKKQITFIFSFSYIDFSFIETLAEEIPDINIAVYMFNNSELQIPLPNVCVKNIQYNMSFYLLLPRLVMSKLIFVDNYQGFLAGFQKKKGQKIIQLWHATGAIKQFGWEDKNIKERSKQAQWRLRRVYQQFDTYCVASKEMKKIFEKSYLAENATYLYYGNIFADNYKKSEKIEQMKIDFYKKYPNLKHKKTLIYAPTFRPGNMIFEALNVYKLSELLGDQWHILLQLHPKQKKIKQISPSITVIEKEQRKKSLAIADCLVTDYSSIIFDYALLPHKKQIYIYAADIESYRKKVGVQSWFNEWSSQASVTSVEELAFFIQEGRNTNIDYLNEHWNVYNRGNGQEQLKKYIKYHIK